jgi:hypothetical protein
MARFETKSFRRTCLVNTQNERIAVLARQMTEVSFQCRNQAAHASIFSVAANPSCAYPFYLTIQTKRAFTAESSFTVANTKPSSNGRVAIPNAEPADGSTENCAMNWPFGVNSTTSLT